MCEVQVFTFTSTMCLVQVFTFTSTLRRIFSRIHTHIHTHTHTHTHLHTPTGGQGNEEGWLSQCIQCTDTHTDIHRHHSVWSVLTHVPHPHVAPLSLSYRTHTWRHSLSLLWECRTSRKTSRLCGLPFMSAWSRFVALCVFVALMSLFVQTCVRVEESLVSLCVQTCVRVEESLCRPSLFCSLSFCCSRPLLPSPCGLCHATGLSCCARVRVRVNACECAQAGGTHATARRH